jgi:hypothetical protein
MQNNGAWKIENWTPFQRNTLQGFFDLSMPPGFVIKWCSYHVKNGKGWIAFPGTVKLGKDGLPVKDNYGKPHYYATIYIPNRELLDRFQAWAVAELRKLAGGVR